MKSIIQKSENPIHQREPNPKTRNFLKCYILNKMHFNLFLQTVSNEMINKMGVLVLVSSLTLWILKRSLGEGTFQRR